MTSPPASSNPHAYKGRKFAVAVEMDMADLRRANSALLKLPVELSQKALRNSFRKWARGTKAAVAAAAPFGDPSPTEWVRGTKRPNPHLKLNVSSKMKTFQRQLVQWVAVGIKEISGSYLTPHWYLRWVERGHSVYRPIGDIPKHLKGPGGRYKPVDWEARVRKWEESNRDAIREARATKTISRSGFSRRVSHVPANPFITRTAARAFQVLAPMVEQEVEMILRKHHG